jgi:hypothetical protein
VIPRLGGSWPKSWHAVGGLEGSGWGVVRERDESEEDIERGRSREGRVRGGWREVGEFED